MFRNKKEKSDNQLSEKEIMETLLNDSFRENQSLKTELSELKKEYKKEEKKKENTRLSDEFKALSEKKENLEEESTRLLDEFKALSEEKETN